MPRLRRLVRYGFAALWIAAAALARQGLDPALGDKLPYVTFFLAITIVAWQVGSGPALAATFLGFAAAAFLFIPARYDFVIYGQAEGVRALAYFAVGFGIVGLRFLSERAERRERSANAELRASEERFRSLILAGTQVVWRTGPDGVPLDDSPSWRAFTGQTLAEWQGSGWLDAIHPDDRAQVAERWQSALGERLPFEVEFRLRRADGHYASTLGHGAPILNSDGSVREWIGTNRDITDRQKAEETQRHLAAIVESSDDAIVAKTLEGIVTSWNRGAERIFGYSAAEMVGTPISRLLPPGHEDELPSILGAIRRGERVEHFETGRLRKDGRRIDVSLTVSPLFDAAGKVVGRFEDCP